MYFIRIKKKCTAWNFISIGNKHTFVVFSFCYWTILMWEIVVLDYFEVGDSTAGLFCCGRLWYWTILKWEILLLDFFEVGDSDAGLSS